MKKKLFLLLIVIVAVSIWFYDELSLWIQSLDLVIVVCVLAGIVLLFCLLKKIFFFFVSKTSEEKLKASLLVTRKSLISAKAEYDCKVKNTEDYPSWITNQVEAYHAKQLENNVFEDIEDCIESLDTNSSYAHLQSMVFKLHCSEKKMQSILHELDEILYQEMHAFAALNSLSEHLHQMKDDGKDVAEYAKQIALLSDALEADIKESLDVYRKAQIIQRELNELDNQ